MARKRKKPGRKQVGFSVWKKSPWLVCFGQLIRGRGRPDGDHLFRVVAEKIPFEALDDVCKHLRATGVSQDGVYVAHDSMGYARYIGRGNVPNRLKSRFRAHSLELKYFSFYIVKDKKHEREIETLLIRAGGPHLQFNTRKKRVDIQPGDIHDFEAGTRFYERQYLRGKKSQR